MCMKKVHSRNIVEVDSIFGRIYAFDNDLITDHVVHFGAHTRPELAFLLNIVEKGDNLFDLGAHIGTFALPLAQKIGRTGRVLAVEGLKENYALLEMNVRRSGLFCSVSLLRAAVVPANVHYRVLTQPTNSGDSFFAPVADYGSEEKTFTLDELCREYFYPRVVKLDLEGYEAFALQNAPMLLDRRPIIYAEAGDELLRRTGSSLEGLDEFLRQLGYRLFKNRGSRNARHDAFVAVELETLKEGGTIFDVLAVHRDDCRVSQVGCNK
jgi:FkbM family methyltransferase